MRIIIFILCLIYSNSFLYTQNYWLEDNGDTTKIVSIDTLISQNGDTVIEYEGEEVLMQSILPEFSYEDLYKSGYYDSLAVYHCDSIEIDINFSYKKLAHKLKGTNLQFMSFFSDSIDIFINNKAIDSDKFIALGNCIPGLGKDSIHIADSLGFSNKVNLTLDFRTQDQTINLEIDLGFEIVRIYFTRDHCSMIVNHENYDNSPYIMRKREKQLSRKK